MELTFDLAEKFLAAQPFSMLLGARLTAFGEGSATLELDIRDDLKQQNGYLHGGVLGYAPTTRSPSRRVLRSDPRC